METLTVALRRRGFQFANWQVSDGEFNIYINQITKTEQKCGIVIKCLKNGGNANSGNIWWPIV